MACLLGLCTTGPGSLCRPVSRGWCCRANWSAFHSRKSHESQELERKKVVVLLVKLETHTSSMKTWGVNGLMNSNLIISCSNHCLCYGIPPPCFPCLYRKIIELNPRRKNCHTALVGLRTHLIFYYYDFRKKAAATAASNLKIPRTNSCRLCSDDNNWLGPDVVRMWDDFPNLDVFSWIAFPHSFKFFCTGLSIWMRHPTVYGAI